MALVPIGVLNDGLGPRPNIRFGLGEEVRLHRGSITTESLGKYLGTEAKGGHALVYCSAEGVVSVELLHPHGMAVRSASGGQLKKYGRKSVGTSVSLRQGDQLQFPMQHSSPPGWRFEDRFELQGCDGLAAAAAASASASASASAAAAAAAAAAGRCRDADVSESPRKRARVDLSSGVVAGPRPVELTAESYVEPFAGPSAAPAATLPAPAPPPLRPPLQRPPLQQSAPPPQLLPQPQPQSAAGTPTLQSRRGSARESTRPAVQSPGLLLSSLGRDLLSLLRVLLLGLLLSLLLSLLPHPLPH